MTRSTTTNAVKVREDRDDHWTTDRTKAMVLRAGVADLVGSDYLETLAFMFYVITAL